MRYTAEEKKKIDDILAAFSPVLEESKNVNIIFLEKYGLYYYIWVEIESGKVAFTGNFENADDLLDTLCEDLIFDVKQLSLAGKESPDNRYYLYQVEIEEIQRRMDIVLAAAEGNKECIHEVFEREKAKICCVDNQDLEHFDIIGIHPQTSDRAVIIMRDKREESQRPWCLQYRGTGRYYETAEEAIQYFKSRGWVFAGQK